MHTHTHMHVTNVSTPPDVVHVYLMLLVELLGTHVPLGDHVAIQESTPLYGVTHDASLYISVPGSVESVNAHLHSRWKVTASVERGTMRGNLQLPKS